MKSYIMFAVFFINCNSWQVFEDKKVALEFFKDFHTGDFKVIRVYGKEVKEKLLELSEKDIDCGDTINTYCKVIA